MQNQRNFLKSKYLAPPEARQRDGNTPDENRENVNKGCLGCLGEAFSGFVAVGVYYCSAIDQFGEWEGGLVDPLKDPIGRTWRLLSAEYVEWMGRMIISAFDSVNVSERDLSSAILKFYRVRDRLEAEWREVHGIVLSTAASTTCTDGDQHSPGGAGAAGGGPQEPEAAGVAGAAA